MPRKRIDPHIARERLLASQAKPVKLRVAASVVHSQLSRTVRFNMRGPEYIAALSDSATALAQIIDIYHVANRKLLRIEKEELEGGKFADGGNIFHGASGTVYRALSVRRGEVIHAIEALRSSQQVIQASAAPPAAVSDVLEGEWEDESR